MGAYLRRDARVRGDIEALLARFPMLATKRREPAGALSGGQQQILEMAIALLLNPRLLMVDEPSLGLDPRMVEIVFDTLTAPTCASTTWAGSEGVPPFRGLEFPRSGVGEASRAWSATCQAVNEREVVPLQSGASRAARPEAST